MYNMYNIENITDVKNQENDARLERFAEDIIRQVRDLPDHEEEYVLRILKDELFN